MGTSSHNDVDLSWIPQETLNQISMYYFTPHSHIMPFKGWRRKLSLCPWSFLSSADVCIQVSLISSCHTCFRMIFNLRCACLSLTLFFLFLPCFLSCCHVFLHLQCRVAEVRFASCLVFVCKTGIIHWSLNVLVVECSQVADVLMVTVRISVLAQVNESVWWKVIWTSLLEIIIRQDFSWLTFFCFSMDYFTSNQNETASHNPLSQIRLMDQM